MSYQSLPKIELHMHHEGAAPPAFIRGLAKEKKVDISGIFTPDGGYAYRDFLHFLEVYEAATSVLQSPEDFRRLTLAILEESARHGVVYAESFISPDFCGGRDVAAWKDYLAAIRDAADEAERNFGITLRGIVTCIRHFGGEVARETARCAQETAGDWIVGFGMGGDENAGHQSDFKYAYDMAREAGLNLTTHAGEWRGPEEIREALDALKVTRIGHGVRAIEDLNLVERLADEGTTLEVCPGSNVFLGVFDRLENHPIAKLRERGVKVTVSTDDPPFFRTTMTREYEDLNRVFGWDEADFADLNHVALDGAFCDADTKARIAKLLEPKDV
ncbi:Aminodeoxyfutalosine deaminase [Aliiroseovarius sp. xm-m-379]|uniref:adenosine deaminase n=1 Tax=unclassified Aliiroseovarius TaxID=2623558 RepID=UPI0015688378|nr:MULTISPECIES: adenosine deaminase [unclassified Aliiroseovarius]NRP11349.1 Aminodeoxyfutalosine deaminase [Aliiroseovarius sp. xm-d-517]NRP23844.1 Aminodeoxyfutalosine deaminase [Aliiroseovarius sp. xm-m-379]NRP28909.1 Aminodeoxyfutalosine deaminase [Aliiroseovarius sp. xm-m-314]NRP32643.1 Aminodeoxyfutalosine deaminase [Aliiroseovarius sp. xm-a-104]NRP42596.1 Aminodeoxyfutalosine deaminase [Aliiroseovarius sp. xm-m-339-2]